MLSTATQKNTWPGLGLVRAGSLEQCFSNFNVLLEVPGVLVKRRVLILGSRVGSTVGSEILNF